MAETLCKLHEEENKNNTVIKSLEAQRQNALKASQNLMGTIEQGIITEQTKLRLKELKAQIAGLDFDMGQEKQRNYTYLSPDDVEKYLNSVIFGDIQEMSVRKLIVKVFVVSVARGLEVSGELIFLLPLITTNAIWFAMLATELVVAVHVVLAMRRYTKALV